MTSKTVIGSAAAALYIGAVVMANWLIVRVGFIEVFPVPGRTAPAPGTPQPWWLLVAPAGVYCAGLTFPLRDVIQRAFGGVRSWLGYLAGGLAIVVAGGLTYLISPRLALASAVTFLLSESLDMTLYTWLQRRWFTAGVVVSSVLAAVADSLLFLWLAHIPYSVALAGQVAGKLEVIAVVGFPLILLLRRSLPLPPGTLAAVPAS